MQMMPQLLRHRRLNLTLSRPSWPRHMPEAVATVAQTQYRMTEDLRSMIPYCCTLCLTEWR